MPSIFITGVAGFIGSNLVDNLLSQGKTVVGWDNFSTGQEAFLVNALKNPNFTLIRGDNLDLQALTTAMKGSDVVFHLAANADVRFGTDHPGKDLEQNTIATYHVLEAMRANRIKRIAFSSTGSVYGESDVIPTPEDAPFPIQTSLYGASKLAGEGLIQAYCEGFGFEGTIFRFVSILGERYTHGHLFDFYKQLLEHPDYLRVLGDGTQRKSYLYIGDCIKAMVHVMKSKNLFSESTEAANNDIAPVLALSSTSDTLHHCAPSTSCSSSASATLKTGSKELVKTKHRVEIYNLGTPEFVQVNDSIKILCQELNVSPRLEYSGGNKGWIGDNPFIFLDTKKISVTGWKPQLDIAQGIKSTLAWLQANQWVFEKRH